MLNNIRKKVNPEKQSAICNNSIHRYENNVVVRYTSSVCITSNFRDTTKKSWKAIKHFLQFFHVG